MDHSGDQPTTLREFFGTGERVEFKHGELIGSSEEDKPEVYYILSGYVKIFSVNPRGEKYVHIIYKSDEIFPLAWTTDQVRRNMFYEALSNVTLLVQSRKVVANQLKNDPHFSYLMLQRVVDQYRVYTGRIDNLEYKYASERLAYRLVFLAERFGIVKDNTVTIEPVITHQVLGSSINLSRESVSREMEKLCRKGLVAYTEKRQIVLLDCERLATQYKIPPSLTLATNR